MSLKQLFCLHVYKSGRAELLLIRREAFGSRYGVSTYANFGYYADYQKCIKCEKTRIVQVKIMILEK